MRDYLERRKQAGVLRDFEFSWQFDQWTFEISVRLVDAVIDADGDGENETLRVSARLLVKYEKYDDMAILLAERFWMSAVCEDFTAEYTLSTSRSGILTIASVGLAVSLAALACVIIIWSRRKLRLRV